MEISIHHPPALPHSLATRFNATQLRPSVKLHLVCETILSFAGNGTPYLSATSSIGCSSHACTILLGSGCQCNIANHENAKNWAHLTAVTEK